jgi:kynurenine formamidase
MNKVIDLSHEITQKTLIHPSDKPIRLFQDRFLDKDKYNGYRLEAGLHVSTHIDAPMHLTGNKKFICEFSLEQFFGKGYLLNMRDETTSQIKLKCKKEINEGDIVLLYTGHDQKWGTESYFKNYPLIDRDLCQSLIEKKVKMVGMDLPSPDIYPFEIHKSFFDANILIIRLPKDLVN